MRVRWMWTTLGIGASLWVLAVPPAGAFTGRVLAVIDGDALSVLHEDRAELVYLYGVDCPEPGQPFAEEADRFAAELAEGRDVSIDVVDPEEEAARLKALPSEVPAPAVIVKVPASTELSAIAAILKEMEEAGISKVAIVTE